MVHVSATGQLHASATAAPLIIVLLRAILGADHNYSPRFLHDRYPNLCMVVALLNSGTPIYTLNYSSPHYWHPQNGTPRNGTPILNP